MEGLPQRRDPVVPRVRGDVRHLHGAYVGCRKALSHFPKSRKTPPWRGFLCTASFQDRFRMAVSCGHKGQSSRGPWEENRMQRRKFIKTAGAGAAGVAAASTVAAPAIADATPEIKWRLTS